MPTHPSWVDRAKAATVTTTTATTATIGATGSSVTSATDFHVVELGCGVGVTAVVATVLANRR